MLFFLFGFGDLDHTDQPIQFWNFFFGSENCSLILEYAMYTLEYEVAWVLSLQILKGVTTQASED